MFQDKEETEKEAAAEIKENGVSDSESPKTPEADVSLSASKSEPTNEVGSPVAESTPEPAEGEKTTEESGESKDSAKKAKEKKKKKWSFRSISFSKKDKSKPTKDAEKNGEVKDIVEEVSTIKIETMLGTYFHFCGSYERHHFEML